MCLNHVTCLPFLCRTSHPQKESPAEFTTGTQYPHPCPLRTPPLSTVQLYRYDLANGVVRTMGPALIGEAVEGICHPSVVAYEREFFFGSGAGVVAATPGQTEFGQPQHMESLGTTEKTEAEFIAWANCQNGGGGFSLSDYHLTERNSNHFSQAAVRFLHGCDMPEDILDVTPPPVDAALGRAVRSLLERGVAGRGAGAPLGPLSSAAAAAAGAALCSGWQPSEADEEELALAWAMLESSESVSDDAARLRGYHAVRKAMQRGAGQVGAARAGGGRGVGRGRYGGGRERTAGGATEDW